MDSSLMAPTVITAQCVCRYIKIHWQCKAYTNEISIRALYNTGLEVLIIPLNAYTKGTYKFADEEHAFSSNYDTVPIWAIHTNNATVYSYRCHFSQSERHDMLRCDLKFGSPGRLNYSGMVNGMVNVKQVFVIIIIIIFIQ